MENTVMETQADMTQKTTDDLKKLCKKRHRLKKKFVSLLVSNNMSDYIRFYTSSWDMWSYYVDAELKIVSKMFEGGSILPMMRNLREHELVKLQIKEITKAIRHIQK